MLLFRHDLQIWKSSTSVINDLQIFDIVDTHFGRLLQGNNQPWLNPNYLQHIAHTIYRKGTLDNIWGFINPFQMGLFGAAYGEGGGQKGPPF